MCAYGKLERERGGKGRWKEQRKKGEAISSSLLMHHNVCHGNNLLGQAWYKALQAPSLPVSTLLPSPLHHPVVLPLSASLPLLQRCHPAHPHHPVDHHWDHCWTLTTWREWGWWRGREDGGRRKRRWNEEEERMEERGKRGWKKYGEGKRGERVEEERAEGGGGRMAKERGLPPALQRQHPSVSVADWWTLLTQRHGYLHKSGQQRSLSCSIAFQAPPSLWTIAWFVRGQSLGTRLSASHSSHARTQIRSHL